MGADAITSADATEEKTVHPKAATGAARPHRILMIGEGLPLLADRRTLIQAGTLRDAGFHVTVLAPSGPSGTLAHPALEGLRIVTYTQPVTTNNAAANRHAAQSEGLQLARLVYREATRGPGFSLLSLGQSADVAIWTSWLNRLVLRKPMIVDYRLPAPEAYLEGEGSEELAGYSRALRRERRILTGADIVQCPNEAIRRLVLSRVGGIADKTSVLPSGSDTKIFGEHPRTLSWFNRRRYLVAFAGPLTLHSGADLFLRAARRIVYGLDRTDVQFAIVGNGPHELAIRDLVIAEALQDYVTCVPGDDPGLVQSVLSKAHLAVDPTPNNRLGGFLTSAMRADYLSLNVPVVAFNRMEWASDCNKNLLLVRSADIPGLADSILEGLTKFSAEQPRLPRTEERLTSWQSAGAPSYVATVERVLQSRSPAAQRHTKGSPVL